MRCYCLLQCSSNTCARFCPGFVHAPYTFFLSCVDVSKSFATKDPCCAQVSEIDETLRAPQFELRLGLQLGRDFVCVSGYKLQVPWILQSDWLSAPSCSHLRLGFKSLNHAVIRELNGTKTVKLSVCSVSSLVRSRIAALQYKWDIYQQYC